MNYKAEISPNQDTGWGLIFRVNDLYREVESFSFNGQYDKWNFKLDRIWVNLTYREDVVVERDAKGKITNVSLKKEDIEIKEFLDKKISNAKRLMRLSKKNSGEIFSKNQDYISSKNELYSVLLEKDLWIRKLMHKNKLYIKEIRHDPAGAMWGK